VSTTLDSETRVADERLSARRTVPRLLLFTLSLMSSCAAFELAAKWLLPDLSGMRRLIENVSDPRGYRLRPGAVVEFRGMFETLEQPVIWRVSPQGTRGESPSASRTGRFRVATYGDSEAFGWALALEDTFQERMEAIDPRVEAINLGVPGYNAANIADQIALTLPGLSPDVALYLVNKNDVDAPIEIPDRVLDSRLLLTARFLYQVTLAEPARLRARRSRERAVFFAGQVARIERLCAAHGIPLMLALLDSRSRELLAEGGVAGGARVVELERVAGRLPKLDQHLGREAHARIARGLCEAIADAGSGCVPSAFADLSANRP